MIFFRKKLLFQKLPRELYNHLQVLSSTYHDYPIFQYVQDNVIGKDVTIEEPYGRKTGKISSYISCSVYSFMI